MVRITGQDVKRGTFSHRHATLFNQETGEEWCAIKHLKGAKGRFEIFNSPLTECACVGFEYGYSLVDPKALVIWEAQFGDFANGAQVIFDQFMAAAEAKWFRSSGLTLLLPHGYEGQGPEHSSARMERFLQLAAEDNIQVVYPSTTAQVFHVLRRQMKRSFRKPLVVMTPKSMLRLPAAQSPAAELAHGQFQTVIGDPSKPDPSKVKRVVFCTGKLFHAADALPGRRGQGAGRQVPRRRGDVGAGRAGEHGRVGLDAPAVHEGPRHGADVRRTARAGQPGRRQPQAPRQGTGEGDRVGTRRGSHEEDLERTAPAQRARRMTWWTSWCRAQASRSPR
jgi:2-oxoglutarate dehydrogenase complex dehydrogenase (E1) component-like enzyme